MSVMAPLPWLTTTFFSLSLPPAIYALYAHRSPHGFLCWFYMLSFCILRVAGNVMIICAAAGGVGYSATGVVVQVVDGAGGMGGLLLVGFRVLFEARRARNLNRNLGLELLCLGGYHFVMGAALTLYARGIDQVVNGSPEGVSWTTQTSTLLKPAMALLFVAWVALCVGVIFSLRIPGNAVRPAAFNDGTKLLYTILFTLPFILCKLIYYTLSYYLNNASTFAASDTNKAVMSFVPEVIATVVLLWAGIATREMWKGTSSESTKAAMETHGWYALEDVPERFEGMKG